jgi:hypothetical protein
MKDSMRLLSAAAGFEPTRVKPNALVKQPNNHYGKPLLVIISLGFVCY